MSTKVGLLFCLVMFTGQVSFALTCVDAFVGSENVTNTREAASSSTPREFTRDEARTLFRMRNRLQAGESAVVKTEKEARLLTLILKPHTGKETRVGDRLDPRTFERNVLLRAFSPLALDYAADVAARDGNEGIEIDDLNQLAMIGLAHALRKYPAGSPKHFSDFALPFIQAEIKAELGDIRPTPSAVSIEAVESSLLSPEIQVHSRKLLDLFAVRLFERRAWTVSIPDITFGQGVDQQKILSMYIGFYVSQGNDGVIRYQIDSPISAKEIASGWGVPHHQVRVALGKALYALRNSLRFSSSLRVQSLSFEESFELYRNVVEDRAVEMISPINSTPVTNILYRFI